MFIFIFLLGICSFKPVALFTNYMKKCMHIENVGSVKEQWLSTWVSFAFFLGVVRASDKNIRIYFSILYLLRNYFLSQPK